MTTTDNHTLVIREAMIQRVRVEDMLNGLEPGQPNEYARGIAEFIAASTLLSTEDGVGDAAEAILPLLYVPESTITYGVELGNGVGCAVEVGGFKKAADAVSFAEGVRGVPAQALVGLPNASVYDPTGSVDLTLPITGASLYSYDDSEGGTLDKGDLY